MTSKGKPIGLIIDFSADTLQARRKWDDIVKVWKKKIPSKNTTSNEAIFRIEEVKYFPDKHKLRKFDSTRPAIQEILKVVLH